MTDREGPPSDSAPDRPPDPPGQQVLATTTGRRIAAPRFLLFAFVTVVSLIIVSTWWSWDQSLLAGFDAGAVVFLGSLWPLTRDYRVDEMRRRTEANDAGPIVLLVAATLVALVVLFVIALELAQKGAPPPRVVALVIVTLALCWLVTNSIFALHYAHTFYRRSAHRGERCGGIAFRGTPDPDYKDFFYFAFTLGMTCQTSDSNITKTNVRRVVILHSLLAFIFTIGVVAFTVNLLRSGGGGTEVVVAR